MKVFDDFPVNYLRGRFCFIDLEIRITRDRKLFDLIDVNAISEKDISTMQDSRLNDVVPPLRKILKTELSKGNQIADIFINAWSEIDICIALKQPFSQAYDLSELVFYRNTDPHYSMNDSYSNNAARQAIEAPSPN